MEMEYKDSSRKGRWIVLLGVVLALVAGGAAFFLINTAQQQAGQSGLKYTKAVVAVLEIPARKPIETADIAVREDIPLDGTNEAGLITDPNELIGRILAVDVKPGQLVTTNLLASTTAGGQFSILKPDETVAPDSEAWRAISLTVSDDRAVGGMLGAGMTVDVFMTATINVMQPAAAPGGSAPEPSFSNYYTDRSTKITYQDMVILSRQGTYYIVKVPLVVAEEISHLQAAGNAQFSLALRPDQDMRVLDVSALGATTNRIIERYGLPIPENFPKVNGPIKSPPPIPEVTPAPSVAPSGAPDASPAASPSPGS
ncbi:MAG: SAF domain-containing protein [Chloroflexi bacterium]|nr:SAF domain-containing protein [Chloroflexota bacterium]